MFSAVRADALERLRGFIYDDEEPVLCRWQGDDGHVVPLYCNLHDHLRVLEDILAYGTWCDDADAWDGMERLYRYFAVCAWTVEQCLHEIQLLLKTANVEGRNDLSKPGRLLKGFINKLWKHRDGAVGVSGACVHQSLHHGHYYFVDDPQLVADDVAQPCVMSLANFANLAQIPCSALVPKLSDVVDQLGSEVKRLTDVLEVPTARQAVETRFSCADLAE